MSDKRYDVFISYARSDDEKTVELVYRKLCKAGLKPWWDREDMTQRELAFTEEIGKAIRSVDRLILFVGANTAASAYVDAEWRYARSVGVKVYPVLYNCNADDPDRMKLVPARLSKGHVRDISSIDNFECETDRLIADLKEPLRPLSVNHAVPALPFGYVEIGEYIDKISDCLFNAEADGIGAKRFVSLNGMGGMGKSTVAASFCHDETVRRAFDDIYWIKLGPDATVGSAWRFLAEELGKNSDLNETEIMREMLRTFAETECLFILDDCWSADIIGFFKNALDNTGNRVLFTARDLSVNNMFDIRRVDVKALGAGQAKKLLANRCRLSADELPAVCDALIEKLGGHPLALSVSAAMYMEYRDWDMIVDSYYEAEADFGMNMPDYDYKNVFLSVSASVKLLSENYRKAFEKLVVFPTGKPVGIAILGKFVKPELCDGDDGKIASKTAVFVKKLVGKSLAEFDEAAQTVSVHPLISDYLKKTTDERALQNLFVERIEDENEKYYYDNIIYHLKRAGRSDRAKLLMFDYGYLIKKIEISGVNELVTDFSYLGKGDRELDLFYDFIRLAAPVIRSDPKELVSQLFGRFEYPKNDCPLLDGLMKNALNEKSVCFVPVAPCMSPPCTALVNHINTDGKIFGLSKFRGMLAVCDNSGCVSLVDAEKLVQIKQFTVDGWALDAFIRNDRLWVAYGKNKLTLFDTESGEAAGRFVLDGMYQAHAVCGKGVYVGDLTGEVYFFNNDNVLSKRLHLHTGISFMRMTGDALEVYGLDKCVYELKNDEFVLKTALDHRVIKADGDAALGYDRKLRFAGGTADGVADFARDGNVLAYITSAKRIVAYDTASNTVIKEFVANNSPTHVVVSGKYLYVSDDQNTVDKWDITLEQGDGVFRDPWVTSQAEIGGTHYYAKSDGKVFCDGDPFIDVGDWPNGIAVSEKYLVFANGVNELKLFDRASGKPICTVNCEKTVTGVACLGDRAYIADGVGTVSIFELEKRRPIDKKKVGSWINAVGAFDDRLIVADRYGRIFLLTPDGLDKDKEIKAGEEITAVAAVQTGSKRFIAYSNTRGEIKLIDLDGNVVSVYHTTISHILSMLYVNDALCISSDLTTERVRILNLT